MKTLAALATLGLVLAVGPSGTEAQDKVAVLAKPVLPEAIIELHDTTAFGGDRTESLRKLGLSEVERTSIETAVRGQIRALATRNADEAFSFLTPVIQDYFADADSFVATLKRQLPPVMQARGFALAGLERSALDAVQHVTFTDRKGGEWLAQFTVERQSDGSWLIKSCQVERAEGQST